MSIFVISFRITCSPFDKRRLRDANSVPNVRLKSFRQAEHRNRRRPLRRAS